MSLNIRGMFCDLSPEALHLCVNVRKCTYTHLDGAVNHLMWHLEAVKRQGKHKMCEVTAGIIWYIVLQ